MPDNKPKAQVEDAISKRLKDYYESVEKEPLPERFLELLEKLDVAEARFNDQGSSDADDDSA